MSSITAPTTGMTAGFCTSNVKVNVSPASGKPLPSSPVSSTSLAMSNAVAGAMVVPISRYGLPGPATDGSCPHIAVSNVPSSVYRRIPVWSLSGSKTRIASKLATTYAWSY